MRESGTALEFFQYDSDEQILQQEVELNHVQSWKCINKMLKNIPNLVLFWTTDTRHKHLE